MPHLGTLMRVEDEETEVVAGAVAVVFMVDKFTVMSLYRKVIT